MNWQHLMYFKKVAECKILTKAAAELYLTPSALSRAINSLEEEIGIVLFDKQGRNIALNRYGRLFYDYVKRATMEIDNGLSIIQGLADIRQGNVRLSSIFSVGTNFIPDLLSDFYLHEENKQISIELSQRTTAQILVDIENGDLDLAFCGEFDHLNKFVNINREPLYDEKIMLIVPDRHPLSKQDTASFDDIKDEIFIGYNNSTGIINSIYDAVARKGITNFKFKTFLESNEDNNTTNLVKKGLGIAFVVDNPSIYTGGIKVLELSDLNFIRTIYMVWKREAYQSPAVRKFRESTLNYAKRKL